MVFDAGGGAAGAFEDPMGSIDLEGPVSFQATFKEHGYHAASLFGIPRVQRGHLVQARRMRENNTSGAAAAAGGSSYTYRPRQALRFMFNPAELTLAWTIREDLNPAGAVPGDTAAAFGTEAAAFNLTLLFDRTYEVYQRDQRTATDGVNRVGDVGVQEDVWQFEKMLGLRDTVTGAGQPLRMVPLLFFPNVDAGESDASRVDGDDRPVGRGAWRPLLGYINSAQVTYTQFSWKMTPIRAVITISFLRYYTATGNGTTFTDGQTFSPDSTSSSQGSNTAPINAIPKGVQ